MKIVIIGYGAIGKERERVLKLLGQEVIATLDVNDTFTADIMDQADWAFICTPHGVMGEIVEQISPHVKIFAEKPYLGTIPVDNVGLNYRFYKGVRALLDDVERRTFGDVISVNMLLGYGDAPGTEKTWKLDPEMAGGGAALDPGIHLIDLAMLMSHGSLEADFAWAWDGFWKTGIDEEVHILAHGREAIYNIQVSKVHWRPTLRIEVNGTDGYGIVEGRNRFYGNQTYTRGKRWGWTGGKTQRESEEIVVDYDGNDSFLQEVHALFYGCGGIQPATFQDNKRCIDFINKL